MTDRSRWDSKRRSPLSDPRRASHSSNSSRGSAERDKSHRDYRRERDLRYDKEKEEYKKDRLHDHLGNHHRKHGIDSRHRSTSRDRSSDSCSSLKSARHDERRSSSQDHRSSSHHKSFNQKRRDSPSGSNYSTSPYSTPPPAPPLTPPPSQLPIQHSHQVAHNVMNSHPHSISQVERPATPPLSHLVSHPISHSALYSLYSSGHHAVQGQPVSKTASYHSVQGTLSSIPKPPSHIQSSNLHVDQKVHNSNRIDHRTSDPRVSTLQKSLNNNLSRTDESKQNFKLIIDPVIKKGHAKVVRYDGVLAGQPPVVPKDPRCVKNKIWSVEVCDLPVPEFKIDRNYCGPMPRNVVRFSGLNDNINRKFLYELCEAYGDIKEYKVYFDPKTNRHTGTGKVVFELNTRTEKVINALNGRPIMGNVIKAWIDEKNPPGMPIMMQLKKECLKFRPSQAGFSHHFAILKDRDKKRRLSTPPTPNVSNMNRNHPVALGYNHSPNLYSNTDGTTLPGYYKNADNPPPPPRVRSPPPPPPKLNYEDISPTGRDQNKKLYSKGKYRLSYKNEDPALLLPVNRDKSVLNKVAIGNSLSNAERCLSPVSPVIKDATPTEKVSSTNYESISDSEHAPHVEDISPAGTPTVEVDPALKDNEDDDAMSLSSISSNEDKVEVVATSQFLNHTCLAQNIQTAMIPISSHLSLNQNIMNTALQYGSTPNVYPAQQHPLPQPHTLSQPRPPLQSLPQIQSHRPPLSHPPILPPSHQSSQTIPPLRLTSPQQHLANQQHPSLHQPLIHQLPPPHPPPHQNTPRQCTPTQNIPSINQPRPVDYRSVAPNQFNSRTSYQQYSNRSNSAPARPNILPPPTTKNRTVTNAEDLGKPHSNVDVLLPISTSRKHAEILRNALCNIPGSTLPLNPLPPQSYPSVPTPMPLPPIIPKDLPFSFHVKSGCARDLSIELKRILAKDTLKKLVEQSAFICFENWWEKQRTSKIEVPAANRPIRNDTGFSRNLLTDKTTNIVSSFNAVPPLKDHANATPALLMNLFQSDKNNENRPPPPSTTASSFLTSYRISRKPAAKTNMKVSHISRKRRPWPSFNQSKRKLQRLEDSEDEDMEDEEGQTEDEEDNQFEQFALHQRQKQKSGSSLYQKIYSDEDENEDDEDIKGTQTQSEDEEEQEEPEEDRKLDLISSSSSSSSVSSDSSDLSSSSESEISESETEEEVETVGSNKMEEQVHSPEPKFSDKKLPLESETAAESVKNKYADIEDISDSEKVTFRSMYDEPRRRAVQNAERKMKELCEKLQTQKQNLKEELPVTSFKENDDTEVESSDEMETRKPLTEINRSIDKNYLKDENEQMENTEKDNIKKSAIKGELPCESDSTVEKKQPNEKDKTKFKMQEHEDENLDNKFIMLEHSYFFKSPSPVENIKSGNDNVKKAEILNKSLNNTDMMSLIDSKQLHRKDMKHRFKMRSTSEETDIIWDIWKQGIDSEDLEYFKEAFESLQQIGAKAVDGLVWIDHPITIISPPKLKRGKVERVHKSGCARTEGYYKIPIAEKAQYLKSALRQLSVLQQHNNQMNNASSQAGTEHHKMKSRENRAMQRRLASSFAQEDYGSLINYNQTLKMRKRALRFARSHIHNWGLFACEPIAAEEFVCEYIGQMIRSIVAELREQRYEKSGIGSSYLFRLDMDGVIDATKTGCNARFINHSCQPNCYAKVILVEGAKKIVIYSKRDIKVGEEITYDYKFPIEDEKIPCMCGTPQCRGSLN